MLSRLREKKRGSDARRGVDFYTRFTLHLSPEDGGDLVAFLKTL
jgi:hypothetical protein